MSRQLTLSALSCALAMVLLAMFSAAGEEAQRGGHSAPSAALISYEVLR